MIIEKLRDINYVSLINPIDNIYIVYINEGVHQGKINYVINTDDRTFKKYRNDRNIDRALFSSYPRYHLIDFTITEKLKKTGIFLSEVHDNYIDDVYAVLINFNTSNNKSILDVLNEIDYIDIEICNDEYYILRYNEIHPENGQIVNIINTKRHLYSNNGLNNNEQIRDILLKYGYHFINFNFFGEILDYRIKNDLKILPKLQKNKKTQNEIQLNSHGEKRKVIILKEEE